MAPHDPVSNNDNSEAVSVDWSTMSYLFTDDDDDGEVDFQEDASFVALQVLPKKQVRISAEPTVLQLVRPLSEMTDEEKKIGWWQKNEHESSKASAKSKCRELRKRGNKQCLTDGYEQACVMADADGDICAALRTITPQTNLIDWCSCEHLPRGLERWSSKLHAFRRTQHVKEVKHAVMLEQARQSFANQRDDERIGRIASAASRRAKVFARLLGEADHIAASGRKRSRNDSNNSSSASSTSSSSSPLKTVIAFDSHRPRKSRRKNRGSSPVRLEDILSVFDADLEALAGASKNERNTSSSDDESTKRRASKTMAKKASPSKERGDARIDGDSKPKAIRTEGKPQQPQQPELRLQQGQEGRLGARLGHESVPTQDKKQP